MEPSSVSLRNHLRTGARIGTWFAKSPASRMQTAMQRHAVRETHDRTLIRESQP
jgi:hypothetical protein